MRTFLAVAHLRAIVLAGAVTLALAPAPAVAQQPLLDVTRFARDLGLTLLDPARGRKMMIGDAVTGSAGEPALLQRIGVRGMHRGARVVLARVTADKVMLEVDEMTPTAARASVQLAIGSDGALRLPAATPTVLPARYSTSDSARTSSDVRP